MPSHRIDEQIRQGLDAFVEQGFMSELEQSVIRGWTQEVHLNVMLSDFAENGNDYVDLPYISVYLTSKYGVLDEIVLRCSLEDALNDYFGDYQIAENSAELSLKDAARARFVNLSAELRRLADKIDQRLATSPPHTPRPEPPNP